MIFNLIKIMINLVFECFAPPRKCKRKKKEPRPLTNKERADFARVHYELHHGKGAGHR